MNAVLSEGLKTIVAYPLRSLLEQQLSRFASVYKTLGFNERIVGTRYMGHAESPYLIRPVTLTTIDTLSLTALGLPPEDIDKSLRKLEGFSQFGMGHYLFSRSMFSLSWLILDEAHLLTDSTKSLSFLIALLRLASINDQKVLMLSATIPQAMMKILKKETETTFLRFEGNQADQEFLADRRRKKYDVHIEALENKWSEHIYVWLKNGLKERIKAILVFNTVEKAIAFYEKIISAHKELKVNKNEILLLHSRFIEFDRKNKTDQLDKNNWRILVATQVIEAGVDISSDFFITELAPANSLVQRLGRFLRRKGEKEGEVYIWYDREVMEKSSEGKNDKYTVYDIDLVRETLSAIESKSRVNFHDPYSYQEILDRVYMEDHYKINRDYIAKLNTAYFQLNRVNYTVDLFWRAEGSFVRENAMVPVIVEDIKDMRQKDINKATIPLGLDLACKYVTGYFYIDEENNISSQKIDKSKIKTDEVLRMSLKPGFLAFTIDGVYDQEKGLLLT
jgi:CRISPR-associated endonuclease/helicase Cas3